MISVNLTTTYQRLDVCRIALVSLLMQSRVPDQINLWVSSCPHLLDKGIPDADILHEVVDSIPCEGIERIKVRWLENTGPYRKLIPALRESNEDDLVITADDDIFYGRTWVETLLESSARFPGEVIAARVRKVQRNAFGKRMSYLYWPIIGEPCALNRDYVITFGGGAVLSRSMFREGDIHNDDYLEVAPTADDLWYTKLLQINDVRVRVVPALLDELYMVEHDGGLRLNNLSRNTSLFHRVVIRIRNKIAGYLGLAICGNDHAIRNIDAYFSKP